jgi:hypothetical protein
MKHLLEGGRVRVSLRPGLLSDHGLAQGDSWPSVEKHHAERGGWNLEVAIVTVENIGRTAVTISNVSLLFQSRPWWRHRKPYAIVPVAEEAPGAMTASTHRLEPFDSATFVYDVWVGLDWVNPRAPVRPLSIRGSVKVAGKRRARRSPWRSRWRVTEGQQAFIEKNAEFDMLAYRRMPRHAKGDKWAETAAIPSVIDIREQFPTSGPAPEREQLQTIIEKHYFGEMKANTVMLPLYLAEDLKPFYAATPSTSPDDATAEAAERPPTTGSSPPPA